jgi:HSP20 family protein
VSGTRQFRRISEEARYHASERAYGAFQRLFPLPNHVQLEKLRTVFANGMLEITIPKTETALRSAESHETQRVKPASVHEEKTGGKKAQ